LAWVKSLPENEKETLRKLRAETVRRHKEGLIPVDNNGKSIDEVFSPNSILKIYSTVEKLSIVVSFSFSRSISWESSLYSFSYRKIKKMKNFYRKNKSNVDLFESYALQLVSGMLLYERIKLQQKKLYLEAIKNLIFQYEHQYAIVIYWY
jgi:hypothetical protein